MKRTRPQQTTARIASEERSVRHRVVAVARRRATCSALAEHEDGPTSLGALAEDVSARDPDVVDGDESLQQVATTLHHVHLPLLDAAGVVEYDPDAKRVWPHHETLADYVD